MLYDQVCDQARSLLAVVVLQSLDAMADAMRDTLRAGMATAMAAAEPVRAIVSDELNPN